MTEGTTGHLQTLCYSNRFLGSQRNELPFLRLLVFQERMKMEPSSWSAWTKTLEAITSPKESFAVGAEAPERLSLCRKSAWMVARIFIRIYRFIGEVEDPTCRVMSEAIF